MRDNYAVVKEFISYDMANLAYTYFQNKRTVANIIQSGNQISPFDDSWGTWKDEQIPNTYSHYGDMLMDTLLARSINTMSSVTKLDLIPTYSYARIYKHGDVLHRHKDRYSCEISTTVNLGGDPWPIYIENDPKKGGLTDNGYKSDMTEGKKVNLKPGDMLVYKGMILEHWREAFIGQDCAQVFLHYNDANSSGADTNIFDGRPHLGLPSWFKGKKINS